MPKNLVIVESPAKAKTIEKFLGSEFLVKSCYGHIRDLPKGDVAIDVANNFQPIYEVPPEKKALVAELKKLSIVAETVWLATDEDREGEAIAWHLFDALKLKEEKTKRIVFHEITKTAILKAVANPRTIDYNLVNAQQARRILDRLVGFELSPVLWRKIKPSLSAGRVQSVAVRLIVEREKEINAFESTSSFKITAEFFTGDGSKSFSADHPKRFDTAESAEEFLHNCIGAAYKINNVEVKPAKKSPPAPFTTSTLQQEASRKLSFSISQTMLVAQKLYEAGHITYMRTDSTNLSELALETSKQEIIESFGSQYSQQRTYATKTAGAQEAHEAIRPTNFSARSAGGESNEKRLYDLIWKRAIASQMTDAKLEKTVATIGISKVKDELVATGEVLKFDGFLKVYMESSDDEPSDEDNAKMLPPLAKGENLKFQHMTATQKFAKPAPRYTEASLVKKLEELGIGRPSTFAPTISTVQKRGYVVKEDRAGKTREILVLSQKNSEIKRTVTSDNYGTEKAKLFPTDIGIVVTDFLLQHFEQIMDYNFTASVEKQFDEIANGQQVWNEMIKDFYSPFHETVNTTLGTAEKQRGEKLLGQDSKSNKAVYAKIGRYGPMVQIGANDDEEKKFASLKKQQSIETITLEEALELFQLPRIVGSYEDKELKIGIGRYGPYIAHDGKFISLTPADDPLTIDQERAVELIEEKRKGGDSEKIVGEFEGKEMKVAKGRFGPYVFHDGKYISLAKTDTISDLTHERAIELIQAKRITEANKLIKEFPENSDVKVLNGRYGPYIACGKKNIKIPKDKMPVELTYEDCVALAEAQGVTIKKAKKKSVKS